ncbi:MAG: hypothetical protein WBW11_04915, partial [Pseudolabrys sp.]
YRNVLKIEPLDQPQQHVAVETKRVDRILDWLVGRLAKPQCPLWVKSGRVQCKRACPLYPRKRTCACNSGGDVTAIV